MAEELRSQFAANLLSAVPRGASTSKLVESAAGFELVARESVAFAAGGAPLELFEALPSLPPRWAVQVASSFDASSPDAPRCAAAAIRDRRRSVRRALLAADELPLDVLESVMADALSAQDDETIIAAAFNQPATPVLWAQWLLHPGATVLHGGAAVSQTRVVGRIVTSAEATRMVAEDYESSHMAARVVSSVSEPGSHPCDFLDVLDGRGDDASAQLVRLALMSPRRFGERGIVWLESLGSSAGRLMEGSLSSLSDPEEIRMWWRANLEGTALALLSSSVPAYPEVAAVVADEVVAAGDRRIAVNVASSMVSADQSFTVQHRSEALSVAETLSIALGLLEWASEGDATAELVASSSAASLLASRLNELVHVIGDEDRIVELLARLAALAPGFCGRVLLRLGSPPPFAADVIADPSRFGVTGSLLVALLSERAQAGLWRSSPELLAQLTVVTPGVPRELSTLHPADPQAVPETTCVVRAAVASTLSAACGSDDRAWDTVLGLAPTWEGSALELAEVASTFRAT